MKNQPTKHTLVMLALCGGMLFSWEAAEAARAGVRLGIEFPEQADAIIKGTVRDGKGPLPGVSVTLKGDSKTGVSTNAEGNFSIKVPENAVLVFKMVGYKTAEVAVNGKRTLNVVLQEESTNLNEVVVVGYTSKQLTQLSSSVSVISDEKLKDVTSNNVTSMLQGKAPGVIVSSPSGNPNSTPSIVIRGSSSITAGSEPLYVVDGIIGGTANPNDVETVTILKDAAATGLYGSRASNGVVIITTKTGHAGKTQINFGASTGLNNASTGNFQVMNSQQLYDYQKTFFAPADFERDRPASLLATDINWHDLAFRTGVTQNYTMSVSGGSEKTSVYISGNYYNEEGTLRHTGREAYNLRANISQNLNKKFKLGFRVDGSFRNLENEASGGYGAIVGSTRNIPWDNPYNEDGSLKMGTEDGWIGREHDSFLHGWQYNFDRTRQSSLSGDFKLDYFIAKGLTFTSSNRASYFNSKGELYYDVQAKAGAGLGKLTNSYNYTTNLITSNRLLFERSLGSHNFSTIAVAEAEKNFGDWNNLFGQGLVSGLAVLNSASQIVSLGSSNGNKYENAFSKGLVQVDYNFANKYFAVGSYIRESSSRFGSNHRAGNFYTLGTSWILTNEDFMKDQKLFNLLKVRASYGITGNAQIGNYQTLGLYSFSAQYGGLSASTPAQLANNDLTWEKAKTLNFGLDLGLFKRITLNADIYDKTSDALLLNVQKPYTSGFSSVIQNVGSVRNRGLELNLTTDNFTAKFKWETNFNIAFNRNKVLALDQGRDIISGNNIISVGHDMNSWYLRKWAGVDPANGDPLWEVVTTDANGQRTVTTTNNLSAATLQFVGTFSPDFTGGMNNSFSYKAFSLSTFFNFVSGNQVFNSSRQNFDSDGAYETVNNMVPAKGWTRWEKPGDIATHPKAVFGGNKNSNKVSSRFLEDGSYIRLRNVTFAYELPKSLLAKISVSNARLFVSGDNLWTGTKYSGMDPEVSLGGGGGSSVDRYPISKKLLFGINIGL